MDTHALAQHFCHVISLASLAYISSGIYAIQYSSVNYNMDGINIKDHNPQENDSTSHSGFTSTPDTSDPADTASSSGKASGCWTDQEITLLLDCVEVHCSLNTTRGLNLKKTQFSKAHNTIKSKDALQCHYKWGHVCMYIIDKVYLADLLWESFAWSTSPLLFGTRSLAVDGMTIMVLMQGLQLRNRFLRTGWRVLM